MDVPTPPTDSPPPGAPPEPTTPLPLKRRAAREEPPPAAGQPDAEILALAGRLQDLIGRRREQESVSSPRDNRLRPRLPNAPADPDGEVLAVLAQAREATAQRGRQYDLPNAEDRLEALAGQWLRRALWPGVCALVALLSFWLGRRGRVVDQPTRVLPPAPVATAPGSTPLSSPGTRKAPVAPPVPAAPRWSEKSLAALDDIFAARRAGDPARAAALGRVLRAQDGALPGLDLFLAENYLHTNQPSDATTALLPMLRAEPPVVDAAARLGFITTRTRQFEEAATYFGRACAADPFRGDLFFRWGEVLRRQGKAAEAVTRFDQALLRPTDDEGTRPAPPQTAFRRRLARLEAGDVEPVRQETTAALNAPANRETGRWLLTAAALELLDNRPAPAITATFARARAALSEGDWDRLTNDLFFRNYATRKELAEFLPPAGSAADARRVTALDRQPDVDFIDP